MFVNLIKFFFVATWVSESKEYLLVDGHVDKFSIEESLLILPTEPSQTVSETSCESVTSKTLYILTDIEESAKSDVEESAKLVEKDITMKSDLRNEECKKNDPALLSVEEKVRLLEEKCRGEHQNDTRKYNTVSAYRNIPVYRTGWTRNYSPCLKNKR